jgi:hypothetical protein
MTFLEEELKEGQEIVSYDAEALSLRYYHSMGYWKDLSVVLLDYDIKEGDAGFKTIKEVTGPVWLVYEHYSPELHTPWENTMLANGITIMHKQSFGESCAYEVDFDQESEYKGMILSTSEHLGLEEGLWNFLISV